MAFCDLRPVRISDEAAGYTYVIGDVFAVYMFGVERPVVYSWDMLESVTVNRKGMIFATEDTTYTISLKMFPHSDDYFRALAIVECARRNDAFVYHHEKRMYPLKDKYVEIAAGKDAYFGEMEMDENDAAATFIMLMNFRLIKILWLVAIFIMLVIFGALHLFVGITRDNLLYFIPISFAGGGIVTLLVYIICHSIARGKFKALADSDLAVQEAVTFVVSKYGFACCESSIYDGRELVPWSEVDYFIESDKMFILYRSGAAIAYIPKRAFDKKYIGGIADIIALNVEQR